MDGNARCPTGLSNIPDQFVLPVAETCQPRLLSAEKGEPLRLISIVDSKGFGDRHTQSGEMRRGVKERTAKGEADSTWSLPVYDQTYAAFPSRMV